jgi:hypothetical protein
MHEDPFARTLRDLESTLTASHIAVFPVWCCLELTRFGGRFRYAAFFNECISSNSIGLL